MANPFDDENGTFIVVVNDQGRHCLWPTFVDVPHGWTGVTEPAGRAESLAYAQENWSDMRTRSLGLRELSGEDGPGRR